jgi:acetyltransferase-like isoleucine patch superfamily enzyme
MSDLRPHDRAPNLWVGVDVEIADDVHLGANVVVHAGVRIGGGSHIEDGAILGKLTRPGPDSISPLPAVAPTVLGEGTVVGSHAVVCTNVTTGRDVFIGDHALVREGAVLGARVSIGHATTIGRDCRLEDGVRTQSYCVLGVGVLIEEEAFLGPSVVVLSGLMLREGETYQARPAVLRRGCHLGSGVQLLPGVEVGAQAVVGAGSVVTRDVPAGARVKGSPAR